MKDNFCIILAGGIGSRFFPLSGKKKPKQFLDLFNDQESLIQKTIKPHRLLKTKQFAISE